MIMIKMIMIKMINNINVTEHDNNIMMKKNVMLARLPQDSNLRENFPADFESAALTTRPDSPERVFT